MDNKLKYEKYGEKFNNAISVMTSTTFGKKHNGSEIITVHVTYAIYATQQAFDEGAEPLGYEVMEEELTVPQSYITEFLTLIDSLYRPR